MPGALEGVRIIDLTAVLLGPFATQHLADMVSEGRAYIGNAWWLSAFPGLVIVLAVLGAKPDWRRPPPRARPRLRGV